MQVSELLVSYFENDPMENHWWTIIKNPRYITSFIYLRSFYHLKGSYREAQHNLIERLNKELDEV